MTKLAKFNYLWLFIGLAILITVIGFLVASLPALLYLAAFLFVVIALLIFKNPFWGIILVVFWLPFERLGAYETALGTLRLSQVFTAVTLLAWGWQMLVNKKIHFRRFPVFIPLILFLVINILGLLNAVNLNRSSSVLLITLFTMTITLITVNLVTDRKKLNRIIIVLLISATLVSFFGLYQFVGDMVGLSPEITGLRPLYTKEVLGFTRIQSTALEPLYFANYLIIPLSIIYAVFLSRIWRVQKWLLASLILLLGVNLFLTISRGGYLGIIASGLIITLIYFRRFFTWKKIILLIITLILLYTIGVQFLQIGGGSLNWETFTEHVGGVFKGSSYEERMLTFSAAGQAFQQYPLVGIGPGGFGPHTATFANVQPKGGWQIVNNEFLELLTETGLLGLGFFIWFLLIIFFRSIKALKMAKDPLFKAVLVGLLGAFLGVLVQYQTFSVLYIMHIWFLFGLIIVCQNLIFGSHEQTD